MKASIIRMVKAFEWMFRYMTKELRALPDFLIIGAQKSGTTSLYKYLVEHPKILPSFKKEVHFFDLNYHKGVGWYRAHFPLKVEKNLKAGLTGEATPLYIFHPHVPQRVHSIIPKVKLIVMLRNPVDRAYSHYWHEVRKGRERLGFEEAIRAEERRVKDELKKVMDNEHYNSFNFIHYTYLTRGIYVEQLRRWMHYFPRKQFFIFSSEEFFSNPSKIYIEILKFLRLPRWEPQEYRVYHKGRYPPMNRLIREQLVDFFKPYNEELYRLIGRKFNWD